MRTLKHGFKITHVDDGMRCLVQDGYIHVKDVCKACKGSGWKTIIKGKKGMPCPECNGTGDRRNNKRTGRTKWQ